MLKNRQDNVILEKEPSFETKASFVSNQIFCLKRDSGIINAGARYNIRVIAKLQFPLTE